VAEIRTPSGRIAREADVVELDLVEAGLRRRHRDLHDDAADQVHPGSVRLLRHRTRIVVRARRAVAPRDCCA
jgi:hypothetical protein